MTDTHKQLRDEWRRLRTQPQGRRTTDGPSVVYHQGRPVGWLFFPREAKQ
jgi:hypothetical protein